MSEHEFSHSFNNSLYSHPELLDHHGDHPANFRMSIVIKNPENTISFRPFKWNPKGFVVRRTDKFETMYLGDVPFHTMTDEITKPYYWSDRFPYIVYCGKSRGEHFFVGFKSATMALYYAHKKPVHKKGYTAYDLYREDFSVTKWYKILKPVIEILEDDEYNQLVAAPPKPAPQMEQLCHSDQYPATETEFENLYEEFESNLIKTISQPASPSKNWGRNSSSVGTLEALPGEEMFLRTSKRDVDFDYVSECVKAYGFPPLVTRFPKSGTVTSKGYIRSIYPMNLLYENVLRRFWGKRKAVTEHRIAEGREFGSPKKYFYDIISCDKTLLPYFSRFCVSHGLKWLIPYVHDPLHINETKGVYLNQFPSGVIHTSIVSNCFTDALCTVLGLKDATIQGDGFMTDTEVKHKYIRSCPDFNGFLPGPDGKWIYNRGHRLTERKYIRGNGPQGKTRYMILYWAYEYLGCVGLPPYAIKCDGGDDSKDLFHKCVGCGTEKMAGLHFWELDHISKCRYTFLKFNDPGRITSLVLKEAGEDFNWDSRTNGWNAAPVKREEWKVKGGNLCDLVFPRESYDF